MSWERDWQIMIQKNAGTYLKDIVSIVICTVDSVDKDNRVCDCTPIGGDADTSMPSVQLCAENDNGLLVFPEIGSTVIVGLSVRNTAFVIMSSALSNIQMLDGTFAGLVKVIELTAKLNVYEGILNNIIAANILIQAAGVSSPGTPVTNGTLAAFLTGVPVIPLTLTLQSEIENLLVTHGTI